MGVDNFPPYNPHASLSPGFSEPQELFPTSGSSSTRICVWLWSFKTAERLCHTRMAFRRKYSTLVTPVLQSL